MGETQPPRRQLAGRKRFAARQRLTGVQLAIIVCIPEKGSFTRIVDVGDGNHRVGDCVIRVSDAETAANVCRIHYGARVAEFSFRSLTFKYLGRPADGRGVVHRLKTHDNVGWTNIPTAAAIIDGDAESIRIAWRHLTATMGIGQTAVTHILQGEGTA